MKTSSPQQYHQVDNIYYSPGELIPGRVNICHFRLLVSVSGIRSPNVCKALEDVMVYGKKRKDACIDNNVTQSNLSIKYHKIQFINYAVVQMHPYISKTEIV
ncbi:PapB/FocB family fimbrial expression transcriptional regulator [Citrobacter sp. Cpo071]|uniref:PapB/FocB family fimbrial expression transcriptional regulator n=1 Tax=Citrobacter sp. Cpo071 TaxID=2985133 RepID=UPI0025791D3B|nr:PapB/FocB family fimbrial expression transcriptional regulator [Citrobacter sp. Cpo071]MDM2857136.1 adhesin biosynthesis transcription regulatory family protein [Citrobacter sp. Cpo071]MDM2857231.1 adhesin biosynthesis transcription regulatory family protein [Citrobacter sp. Cpo071]